MEQQAGQQSEATTSPPRDARPDLLPISSWKLLCFHVIARRRVKRAFRALRIANTQRLPATPRTDLIVCLNHPSWWDPLVGFVLSRYLFQRQRFYAPMDATALNRYALFSQLGLFPVAMDSPRGAAQFLRTAGAVLDAGHILAVTPQGQFTDVRVRPVQLRAGLAALIRRRTAQGRPATVLPLALEYTFWDQRLPEALVNCGELLHFGNHPLSMNRAPAQDAIQDALEEAMTRTQDELAALSLRRDPREFSPVLEGRRGSAGFYGLIEALRALTGGNPQRGDHQGRPADRSGESRRSG